MDTPRPHIVSYWLLAGTLLLFPVLLVLPWTHRIAANQCVRLFTTPNDYAGLMQALGIQELPYHAESNSRFDGRV
ncbi:MAG TPA: hypothetical protein VKU00_26525 [Chthonomonadaceae bacterium]|nr:hypothetical protein [Chthonomonadaceae bacterium]